jgi:hypothetical protein
MSRYNPRSVPPTKAQKEFIHKVKCLPCIVEHLDWYKKLGMKWKEPETKIVPRQAVEFDPEIETYDDL